MSMHVIEAKSEKAPHSHHRHIAILRLPGQACALRSLPGRQRQQTTFKDLAKGAARLRARRRRAQVKDGSFATEGFSFSLKSAEKPLQSIPTFYRSAAFLAAAMAAAAIIWRLLHCIAWIAAFLFDLSPALKGAGLRLTRGASEVDV